MASQFSIFKKSDLPNFADLAEQQFTFMGCMPAFHYSVKSWLVEFINYFDFNIL